MQASGRAAGRSGRGWAFGLALALASAFGSSCASVPHQQMSVTATAYNSLPGQTQGDPSLGAWGDRLSPGMRVIAVSRDLVPLGLTRGIRVRIRGLEGEYVVLDKLAARWKRRIDIYMGTDVEAARRWGKRTVQISWAAD
jgi:3D (Asp-Asp-Asp) domain-containing protein